MTLQNGASGGSSDTDDDQPEQMAVGEVPVAIFELGEGCRQFVLSAVGVELDYSTDTLPVLDEYLRMVRASIADRPQLEPVLTRSIAAYFGEVVRRYIDGFWRKDPKDPEHWYLSARRTYLSMSPLGVVLECLAAGAEHPGPGPELDFPEDERETVESRLAIFPEVPEDQYFLLSTRLEVIEVVYEALRERMRSDGRESLVYEEEDYAEE